MRKIKSIVLLLCLWALAVTALAQKHKISRHDFDSPMKGIGQDVIKSYSIYNAIARVNGAELLVLRKMVRSGQLIFLVVNPETLNTQLLMASGVSLETMSRPQVLFYFKNTPYVRAIETAGNQDMVLQDAGITHGFLKEKGITLTVDLCPSHKSLDRILFTSLISEFQKIEKPVPIALSITGRFMLTHGEDLNWLNGLVKSGDISITWVNHTYNHHYNPKALLRNNFLLEPGTDLNFEILGTEVAMLQMGYCRQYFLGFLA